MGSLQLAGVPTSSIPKDAGLIPAERSFWTPACFPRSRCAIVVVEKCVAGAYGARDSHDSLHSSACRGTVLHTYSVIGEGPSNVRGVTGDRVGKARLSVCRVACASSRRPHHSFLFCYHFHQILQHHPMPWVSPFRGAFSGVSLLRVTPHKLEDGSATSSMAWPGFASRLHLSSEIPPDIHP